MPSSASVRGTAPAEPGRLANGLPETRIGS
jgi:hypothetical protein